MEDTNCDEKKKKEKRLPWVNDPIPTLFVEVWKAKRIIKRIPLGKKNRILFGRCKEADVPLLHPSLSRKHAALVVGCPPGTAHAFKATLIDLKTSNGTFVSLSYPCRRKKGGRCKPNGTLLKENMCFRFGESSRSYVLRGTLSMVDGKNPNFVKKESVLSKQLDRDFCNLGSVSSKPRKKRVTKRRIISNPFREKPKYSNPLLPELNPEVHKKILSGETTFSFHKRRKTELDHLKDDHEKKYRKRVALLKEKEKREKKK